MALSDRTLGTTSSSCCASVVGPSWFPWTACPCHLLRRLDDHSEVHQGGLALVHDQSVVPTELEVRVVFRQGERGDVALCHRCPGLDGVVGVGPDQHPEGLAVDVGARDGVRIVGVPVNDEAMHRLPANVQIVGLDRIADHQTGHHTSSGNVMLPCGSRSGKRMSIWKKSLSSMSSLVRTDDSVSTAPSVPENVN